MRGIKNHSEAKSHHNKLHPAWTAVSHSQKGEVSWCHHIGQALLEWPRGRNHKESQHQSQLSPEKSSQSTNPDQSPVLQNTCQAHTGICLTCLGSVYRQQHRPARTASVGWQGLLWGTTRLQAVLAKWSMTWNDLPYNSAEKTARFCWCTG